MSMEISQPCPHGNFDFFKKSLLQPPTINWQKLQKLPFYSIIIDYFGEIVKIFAQKQRPLWDTSARGARGPVSSNIHSFVDACNRAKFSLFSQSICRKRCRNKCRKKEPGVAGAAITETPAAQP